ncbi:TonB-dependent receptor domain-containing protein [Galbibacter mesophilus]|uniref:TonB-dependent receptor domain-containing protein n=1 Tax=Galbibacter mesophilus TaxID=379069 RepID=UPI00191F2F16|nr:TonB-dependent receptor [Galbibacter mesophilus]MCM5663934.1 TonB-dependent receptor [Galbibacter mesophilus]
MKLKDYKLFVLLFCITPALWAQYSIQGVISSENKPIAGVEIYDHQSQQLVESDADGFYILENVTLGKHIITIFSYDYKIVEDTLVVTSNITKNYELEELNETLSEVVLTRQKERVFALKKLRNVEGTAIYAGKKSEVVDIDQIIGNTAANNPRQIYAQVVGLNIYENGDAGLQLNIGGRGLDPNRTANFNTRQNGYDISADVLGYPESYYTPPAEALSEIQVVRGAASLQYGTQFGGLVNFKMKKPNPNKKIEWVSRQTLGSYGLFTSFNSLGGTVGDFEYYTFFNYKQGDGFRPNSQFNSRNFYNHIGYRFSEKTKISFETTLLNYLAKQPGGLTDAQFEEDPTFSNRYRNWFEVDWKLFSLLFEHQFSSKSDFSLNLFGLDASRNALGFRENRVDQPDEGNSPRDFISGKFRNWGAEARFLHRYKIAEKDAVFLIGSKYYQANNAEKQGPGSANADADFNFYTDDFPNYPRQSDFTFPNRNISVFGENIFNITDAFSVTPGFRFEYIKTESEGTYKEIQVDLAGNPTKNETFEDNRLFDRSFVLLGLGLSYKPSTSVELYGNISQNYRSVTYNDIRIVNPSFEVDPDITDEDGYTADLGARGKLAKFISYDLSAYFLSYNNRIGVISRKISNLEEREFRGNIGDAIIYGIETFADWDMASTFLKGMSQWQLNVFTNIAFTNSKYVSSQELNVEGNQVEFVPHVNLKTGLRFGYKNLQGSLQYTYLSSQYSDAFNQSRDFSSPTGIIGEIPSYDIMDVSLAYSYKRWKLETGINNVLNNSYFTRRATGYPGPGILPAEPLTWYTTLQFKW